MPSFGVSVATSLVPVILMALRAVAEMVLPRATACCASPGSSATGDNDPDRVLIAIFTFGLNRGRCG